MKPYEGKAKYIFISYAHKDSDAVYPILAAMQNEGFRVWYDLGIEIGAEWPEYIAEHLINAHTVIAFMSENAAASRNCRNEINEALNQDKDVLVVYLKETELTPGMRLQLNSMQSIFYYKHASHDSFLGELFDAKALQPCRKATKPNAPDMSFATASARDAQIEACLERGFLFLEDKKWANADKYFEKALDLDPKTARAYLGKLLVEYQLSEPQALQSLSSTFVSSEHYKNVKRFGDEALLSELSKYDKAIKDRAAQKKLNEAYRAACQLQTSGDHNKDFEDWIESAAQFQKIAAHKDSATRAEQCLDNVYRWACEQLQKARTRAQCETARKAFVALGKYRDTKDLIAKCFDKEGTFLEKEQQRKEKKQKQEALQQQLDEETLRLDQLKSAKSSISDLHRNSKILIGLLISIICAASISFWLILSFGDLNILGVVFMIITCTLSLISTYFAKAPLVNIFLDPDGCLDYLIRGPVLFLYWFFGWAFLIYRLMSNAEQRKEITAELGLERNADLEEAILAQSNKINQLNDQYAQLEQADSSKK